MLTYEDFIIKDLDKEFIDKLLETYTLDSREINLNEIDIENIGDSLFANIVISAILTTAINQLYISEDNKEYLQSKIYCNCFDSGYDISSEDVDDMIDGTNEEKEIIKELLDM